MMLIRDVDIGSVLKSFKYNLQSMRESVYSLISVGDEIEAALRDTEYATEASGTIRKMGEQLLEVIENGEELYHIYQQKMEAAVAAMRKSLGEEGEDHGKS